jgi:cytochrome P450
VPLLIGGSPVYILQNPVWHDRVRAEIDAFVRTHHVGAIPQPGGILAESLGDVPLSAWDGNLPILDMCIQETVRLVADGVLPRRLAGTDPVQLNGRTILPGDFVLVPTQPHNLDPELHDDPLEFRPDRDLTRANSAVLGNLAWGAGKIYLSCGFALTLQRRAPRVSRTTFRTPHAQAGHCADVVSV